jgi:hypothetical protein
MRSGHGPNLLGTGRLPGVRQQFGDSFHREIGQAGNDIDQVSLGIDTLETTVFDQGEETGEMGTCARMSDREPVFRAELERADAIFCWVIVDPRSRLGEATHDWLTSESPGAAA